jgi:hypothetical protein
MIARPSAKSQHQHKLFAGTTQAMQVTASALQLLCLLLVTGANLAVGAFDRDGIMLQGALRRTRTKKKGADIYPY